MEMPSLPFIKNTSYPLDFLYSLNSFPYHFQANGLFAHTKLRCRKKIPASIALRAPMPWLNISPMADNALHLACNGKARTVDPKVLAWKFDRRKRQEYPDLYH